MNTLSVTELEYVNKFKLNEINKIIAYFNNEIKKRKYN